MDDELKFGWDPKVLCWQEIVEILFPNFLNLPQSNLANSFMFALVLLSYLFTSKLLEISSRYSLLKEIVKVVASEFVFSAQFHTAPCN